MVPELIADTPTELTLPPSSVPLHPHSQRALDRITRLAAQVLQVPIVLINLVDGPEVWVRSAYGATMQKVPRANSFSDRAIQQGGVLIMTEILAASGLAQHPLMVEHGMRSIACVPLSTEDYGYLGTLLVADTQPLQLTGEQLTTLIDLAAMIVDELELQQAIATTQLVQQTLQHYAFDLASLRQSEAELRSLFEVMSDVILLLDAEGRYLKIAPTRPDLLYRPPAQLLGKTLHEVFAAAEADNFLAMIQQVLSTQTMLSTEYCLLIDGREVWFATNLSPIADDRVLLVSHDISARKQAEAKLNQSLREKEVLLQEIHHRVKNNLQIISSLLDLQALHLSDPTIHPVFQQSRDRIRAMALLHETLYQSQDLSHIDMVDYVASLTNHLLQVHRGHRNITLQLDINVINLDIDQAMPCGLIINELVTNALKHGFLTQQSGTIQVKLARLANHLTLIVSNDGSALPAQIDLLTTKTLGFKLVNRLVQQLGGTLGYDYTAPVTFTVQFPYPKDECSPNPTDCQDLTA
jgi:PAS domain S-box-containing protein